MAFTETFGGTTIYPSSVSYRAISLSANVTLSWPLETATNQNIVAQIMDVTPSGSGFTIRMPPANEAGPGETALFFNAGSFNFTVADNAGNTIVSIAPGLAYQVYLRTNTTVAGLWRTTQFGAGTSSATAGSLVGAGIKAINTTLNQSMAVSSLSVNYTAGPSDRSSAILWTGGAGTITLPAASTVGNDWFFHVRNGGTGAISLATTGGEFINGTTSAAFNPGDSAIIVCDGSKYFTIGFGQAPEFLFDYVSIDLTGQASPYTLVGANLNRISYQFSGVLTTNMVVIVPATIQQYWVGNSTTGGSYTLTVKTAAGTGVAVARDSRSILYCNGTDVVIADTGGIGLPILVSQGGTGATTPSGARTNLGATSVGNAVFIAVDDVAARNAITAAKSGANSDITSLTGLTTPLSVAQGGTGVTTSTGSGSVVRATSPTLVTPILGAASATSIAMSLGSAAAPSITFTGDTNTGIFSPAADTIAFTKGGVEAARIDPSGNFGIGTSSPGYRLDIASADTTAGLGYAMRIRGNLTAAAGTIQFTDSTSSAQWGFLAVTSTTVTLECSSAGSIIFRTNAVERARIGSTGIMHVNTTATPSAGTPRLVVNGGISGVGTVTINSSTATTIAEGSGLLLLIRNNTYGGTAVVQYENTATPIIIATSGGTTFQTGTPSGGSQIQLTNRSGNLGVAALASGDRNNSVLSVTILQTF